MNISNKTLSDYERNISKPNVNNLINISNFYNVPFDILLDNNLPQNNNRIKELRLKNNLTIVELSKNINIDKSTLSRYERNEQEIKSNHLILLANYFNISIDYLLLRSDFKTTTSQNSLLTNRLRQLRMDKNLSLRELSEKTNINFTALSRIETGNRNLNNDDIKILTSFFNCSSDFLLGLSNENKSNNKVSSFSEDNLRLLKKLELFSDEEKMLLKK